MEIAIESAAPPIADFQNPADIADALQRENTMPEPEPPSPVISLTSDLTMLQEGGQVILRISSDIAAPSGGLMVTINIGNAMADEFGIAGGDCTALECVVIIPAGMLAAALTITPISDTAMESAERWTATLGDGGLNYNIDNTMMDVGFDISDQSVIGIATADMAMVREGGEIRLTVSSDIAAPSGGLMVTINIGNAMAGEFGISGGDCTALECVVVIPAGMLAATLTITPISDTAMESAERWTATLGDGGLNYNIDNTMMAVGFDISDQPVIGIATADMAMVREGGEIRLTVSSDIAAPSGGLMVTINIGNAMAGEFGIAGGVCTALECVVTIPESSRTAELILTPISDSVIEDLENWMATLGDGGLNYNIDNTMMNVGFDISDDPLLLAVVDGVDGVILDDAPHVQGYDVLLAWHAVPGFDSASLYRVYRDGVRADGEFIDDRDTESLTIDNGLGPLSFSIDSCGADGCLLDSGDVCSPADACRAAVENVPGTSFLFGDFGLFDAESGRLISLFDGGVSHTYEIRAVDENGVETLVVGPITFTAPAVVDNNLEVFVPANSVAVDEVNDYLPVLDAVMPSDFVFGNGGILASQTNVDVISDDRVFSYSNSDEDSIVDSDFRASTYEGMTPDLGYLLGSDDQPRVYVYRATTTDAAIISPALLSFGAGIEEFTFSYAIEAGAVTRLTDYDVLIRPSGERWEFGLADGSRVDLTHAETFFEVEGTADLDVDFPGDGVSGIASFGSNNERVFSRFSVAHFARAGRHLLSGKFDIIPQLDSVVPIVMPDPDPRSPVISLTSDLTMLQEGRQVILRVSSDLAAPSGGLMVTINIGNAMAGEFGIAGGVCTALECVVVIPAGMLAATLTITPISDSVIEDLENWMVTLGDGGLNYNIDNTMMNVGFDISDDPLLLAVVDVVDGVILDDAPHVQGHDVVLAWHAVPGFDSASSYRVYRDGVRADGEFIDDRGTESLTINNELGPLSFPIQSCDVDGCLLGALGFSDNRGFCSPADACRAAAENVPGTSFGFVDFGLFDAESGRIIGLFDGGVSHTYEIRAVDENGVETLVAGPIAFTAPAVVNNNLEVFVPTEGVVPPGNRLLRGQIAILEVNDYLPVLDAVMPSDFIIGNGGILASQTDVDVISDDGVFSYSEFYANGDFTDFRASTYEGTTPDLSHLLGLDDPPRVYVYRIGGLNNALTSRGAGIEEFTFSYAIEAGAVTRLTDYDVLIRPSGERWEFGLADGSSVDLTHAETFFDVAGTADLNVGVPGDVDIDGIASFGSNNERVFSRFSVEGGLNVLSGRFDIPAGGNSE